MSQQYFVNISQVMTNNYQISIQFILEKSYNACWYFFEVLALRSECFQKEQILNIKSLVILLVNSVKEFMELLNFNFKIKANFE